jgi:hypothetical protein
MEHEIKGLRPIMKGLVKKLIRRTGFDLIRYHPAGSSWMRSELVDLAPAEIKIAESVERYTLTSSHRIAALIEAIHYITNHGIPGDFVECGSGVAAA